MRAVVIGQSSGATRDATMAVYPRDKAIVDKFVARGVVWAKGRFPMDETWPFSRRERKRRPFRLRTRSCSRGW